MDKDQLIKRLMETFLEELEEHIGALNRDLLALEKNASDADHAEHLKTLFRTAHSLKGAARSVNATLIESACHRLEEILSAVRDGKSSFTPELFVLLFATADAIEEAGMRLREQQDLVGAPLAALLPRLEAALTGGEGDKETRRQGDKDRNQTEEAPAAADFGGTTVPAIGLPKPVVSPSPCLPVSLSPAATEMAAETTTATTVRVPAEKLDAFLARNGELLVARRRVQSRAEEVTALRELVGRWKAEWRAVEKPVAKFLQEQESDGRSGAVKETGTAPLQHLPRRAALALGRVRDHLRQMDKDLERLAGAMAVDGRVLKEAASAIDDEVRRVRMLPFAEACQGLDRMVRDLSRAVGKDVELVIEGGDVELDRSVLEGLKDPLRHLVRNAVDHGAETPEERRPVGKPPYLRLTVAAVVRGAQVEVVVADDGRGINIDALRAQVRKKGLPEPADPKELAQAVFLPGFSTSKFITDVSGRGVGLDVVKSRVEALHGGVELSFTPGAGTRFTLSVPLTLTTLRVLLVAAGGQTFALSSAHVQKFARAEPAQARSVEGRQMLALGERPVPLASLAETLGLTGPQAPTGKAPVVVLSIGDKRMAFVVEEFQAELEVVIKSLGAADVRRTRFVSAATILPSGKIALVLNTANIIRKALQKSGGPVLASPAQEAKARKRILVADDSLTTRALEKSILEAAGYDVTAAADGAAAWQALQEGGADLVVSDVDMPRMDGFALTEAVRGSERFRQLPVVLVTVRETESDRTRGIEVGADAYLGKSGFDQKNLLQTIAQLLCESMIRVLVADDSGTARAMLVGILSSAPGVTVVGEARDGLEAVNLTQKLKPNLVTMDLTMPRMDGFTATKEIMIATPTPIVIVTGSNQAAEVATAMRALSAGALAVLKKPPAPDNAGFEEARQKLVSTVETMAHVKVVRHWRSLARSSVAEVVRAPSSPQRIIRSRLVAIAASTGGPAALQELLSALPADFPAPILVVQHIARGFTGGLAAWLDTNCRLRVKLAEDNEPLTPHTVYLAPDDRHLGAANPLSLALSTAAPVGGFRPSGTHLFESAARVFGPSAVAVILTGMGDDGVVGLRAVRQAGGRVIAQDEESCVVYGMPGAAVAAGVTEQVLPLDKIALRLTQLCQ